MEHNGIPKPKRERRPPGGTARKVKAAVVACLAVALIAFVPARRGLNQALYRAAGRGDPERAALLLASRADPNSRGPSGATALHTAIRREHWPVALLLVRHGARQTVYTAAALGDAVKLRELLAAGASPELPTDEDGCGPLHQAARHAHLAAAELLLASGADANAVDLRRQTPLYLASEAGRVRTARLLMDKGADLYARDWIGRTPLEEAATSGNAGGPKVLEMMLKRGAAPNYKARGLSLLQSVQSMIDHNPNQTRERVRWKEAVRVLRAHGAR